MDRMKSLYNHADVMIANLKGKSKEERDKYIDEFQAHHKLTGQEMGGLLFYIFIAML